MSVADDIVRVARAMRDRGLVTSTVGNVSARIPDGMLITPTRHDYDALEAAHLVGMRLDGECLAGAAPSQEWPLHAAIYRHRPDVGAVVHTHSPFAVARSFCADPIVVETEERTYLGLHSIPVAAPAAAGTNALASAAVAALGDGQAVLLARHGVVCAGSDAMDALEFAATVEQQSIIEAVRAVHEQHSTYAREAAVLERGPCRDLRYG